jgi:hypothetical protein
MALLLPAQPGAALSPISRGRSRRRRWQRLHRSMAGRPQRQVPGTQARPEADRRQESGCELGNPGSWGSQKLSHGNSFQQPSSMQQGAVGDLALLPPRWPPLLCVSGHPSSPEPPPRPRPQVQPPPPTARPKPPRGKPHPQSPPGRGRVWGRPEPSLPADP